MKNLRGDHWFVVHYDDGAMGDILKCLKDLRAAVEELQMEKKPTALEEK